MSPSFPALCTLICPPSRELGTELLVFLLLSFVAVAIVGEGGGCEARLRSLAGKKVLAERAEGGRHGANCWGAGAKDSGERAEGRKRMEKGARIGPSLSSSSPPPAALHFVTRLFLYIKPCKDRTAGITPVIMCRRTICMTWEGIMYGNDMLIVYFGASRHRPSRPSSSCLQTP